MNRVMSEIVHTFKQVLGDISPRVTVEKALHIQDGRLTVNNREYELNHNVRIVASGKAAVQMVVGAENALGNHVRDGIASVPVGSSIPNSLKTKFYEAAEHNLPDRLAMENTDKILKFLNADIPNKSNALILFLISGGASALLCLPVDGVSLEDKLEVTRLLASNGADITELNTVRISLSKVKGGQLAWHAVPSKAISLIISDIVGGKIDKVGSGPTVRQEIEPQKARQILERRGLWNQVPGGVRSFLGKHSKSFQQPLDIENVLICDNRVLLQSFKRQLDLCGIITTIINSELEGDAQEVGEQLAEPLKEWLAGSSNICPPFNKNSVDAMSGKRFAWLYGGETTVQFPPNFSNPNAKGGRNQEMVLAVFGKLRTALATVQKRPERSFYFASLGSDGQDGPTDATGALIHSKDLDSQEPIGDTWKRFVDTKDSYHFWSQFHNGGRLIRIGKTGNNLMDVQLLFFESN